MPIRVPDDLPAVNFLRNENVFVMTSSRAKTQEIRPLKVLVLNLMPKKKLTFGTILEQNPTTWICPQAFISIKPWPTLFIGIPAGF